MEFATMSVPPRPFQVRHIDHVTFVVGDLDRSRAFYVGLIGMAEVARPAFNFQGLWFQAGATQIHLILAHDQSGPAGMVTPPVKASPGRVLHFALEIDDARTIVPWLEERGVVVRGGPSLRPDGCVQVFCVDPDGHVVELFSRPV
jgi:catechol 2,3-dioxygenase-like lactoylglutathione lyase family enzyme